MSFGLVMRRKNCNLSMPSTHVTVFVGRHRISPPEQCGANYNIDSTNVFTTLLATYRLYSFLNQGNKIDIAATNVFLFAILGIVPYAL